MGPADAVRSGPGATAIAVIPVGAAIGEVLDRLRGEFPDITVSKIRYLEAEGLVTPGRSRSGYRRFTAADVERLRAVLRLQRDEYLPLRVIRARLDTAPELPPPDVAPAGGRAGEPRDGRAPSRRVHRDELLATTGLAPQTLLEMESHGLLRGRSGWYDADDMAVARAVVGLTAHGVAPRHLRGLRSAAEREAGLIEQVLLPQLRSRRPDSRARAQDNARELRELTRQLHDALVDGALRDAGLEPR